MSEDDFDAGCGDLFVPDDMGLVLRDSTPNFRGRTMPLIGPTGAGKTTLFNKLTGSTEETSGGRLTQTQHNVSHPGLEPAQGLSIIDTPGYASEGMTFDHAFELRKALTTGEVAQIVVVQDLGNSRQDNLMTMLAPINDIMSCDTFYLDRYGRDSRNTGCTRSPYRTRVFLVFTKRDLFQLQRDVAEWTKYIRFARARFPWIGPVALIDQNVSTEWLQRTVVACAGYEPLSCHSYTIPMPDFFARFPLQGVLTEGEKLHLHQFSDEICLKFRAKLEEMSGKRADAANASVVELIGFLDDIFERTAGCALVELLQIPAEDLRFASHEEVLNHRTKTWNSVRAMLAKVCWNMKAEIRHSYPQAIIEALYKRCNYCHQVYVKPYDGCSHYVTCPGYTAPNPKPMPVAGSSVKSGCFCGILSCVRRRFFRQTALTPRQGAETGEASPCDQQISWATMPPVPQRELVHDGVLPESVESGIETVEAWLCELGLGQYALKCRENGINAAKVLRMSESDLQIAFGMTNTYHARTILHERKIFNKHLTR